MGNDTHQEHSGWHWPLRSMSSNRLAPLSLTSRFTLLRHDVAVKTYRNRGLRFEEVVRLEHSTSRVQNLRIPSPPCLENMISILSDGIQQHSERTVAPISATGGRSWMTNLRCGNALASNIDVDPIPPPTSTTTDLLGSSCHWKPAYSS